MKHLCIVVERGAFQLKINTIPTILSISIKKKYYIKTLKILPKLENVNVIDCYIVFKAIKK